MISLIVSTKPELQEQYPEDTVVQVLSDFTQVFVGMEMLDVSLVRGQLADTVAQVIKDAPEYDDSDSNLLKHAKRELDILGVGEHDQKDILGVVRAFVNIHPSGSQAAWLIPIITDLLSFKPLTPLTDNPEDWIKVDAELWQNARRSSAFSKDGGKTYTILDDGVDGPIYTSEKAEKAEDES